MRKKDWIICDLTGIILNDGVTLYPGYVEILDGVKYTYTTDDPMNEMALYKRWLLHNRVQHKITVSEPCDDERLQGKHFLSEAAMKDWLTTQEQ